MSDQQIEKTLDQKKEEIFQKLQKEWGIENFVVFNEFDLSEKLQRHPFMLSSFHQKLENEKFQLEKIKMLLEKVEGEAFEKIQKEHELNLRTSEIEKYYLPRDPKVKKVKEALLLQQFIVNYFDVCVKSLSSMGWSIKNFVDASRL